MQGVMIPRVAILAFAPFLSLLTLRLKLPQALWIGAGAGALMDLLSEDPMGLHALNYVIVIGLLYRIRKHFSYNHPLHLSLFTLLISFFSTVIQIVLLFLFDRRIPFGGKWIFGDLIGMPVLDALYAFVCFAAPFTLFEKLKHIWMVFWLKRKNPSHISH